MPIKPGGRFGPYEILAAIGAGGMGQVFRARDIHLQRDVALKVLPEHFAQDPARRLRFEREAQILAALNRPNIAQIYGIESRNRSQHWLWSSFRVRTSQCDSRVGHPATCAIARQIAEALEAAGEQGIIHRDLKPANILIRADGAVKVLDSIAKSPRLI